MQLLNQTLAAFVNHESKEPYQDYGSQEEIHCHMLCQPILQCSAFTCLPPWENPASFHECVNRHTWATKQAWEDWKLMHWEHRNQGKRDKIPLSWWTYSNTRQLQVKAHKSAPEFMRCCIINTWSETIDQV